MKTLFLLFPLSVQFSRSGAPMIYKMYHECSMFVQSCLEAIPLPALLPPGRMRLTTSYPAHSGAGTSGHPSPQMSGGKTLSRSAKINHKYLIKFIYKNRWINMIVYRMQRMEAWLLYQSHTFLRDCSQIAYRRKFWQFILKFFLFDYI